MKNKKLNIILVIIWMIFIFIMSSFNSNESSNQSNFIVNILSNIFNISNIEILSLIVRKLAHFIEYTILGILVYNLIYSYNKKIYISTIICIIYAISDEMHQLFVPGRSCQITDILIDSMGSVTGIILLYILYRHKFKYIDNNI